MSRKTVVLATSNPYKIAEVSGILPDCEILGMREAGFSGEIEENGSSFCLNALIKARAVFAATGLLTVADDSGICVDALGGAPGILSARFSGAHGDDEANNLLLLEKLAGVPEGRRGAFFVCAAAAAGPGGREALATGSVAGTVAFSSEGGEGFGYDRVFLYGNPPVRFSMIPMAEKNMLSHRRAAFTALAAKIGDWR